MPILKVLGKRREKRVEKKRKKVEKRVRRRLRVGNIKNKFLKSNHDTTIEL